MKHIYNLPDSRTGTNRKLPSTYIAYSCFLIAIAILTLTATSNIAFAQTLSHPASEVSTAIKQYKYKYNISPTKFEEIGYILVRASNGDIKSAFNACDVCYLENKGYSQSGTKLRCNNCGKTFEIDNLGTQGSGGCWPGHLPHSNDGDNVIIDVSELIKGAYLFPVQTISDVTENAEVPFTIKLNNNSVLQISAFVKDIKSYKIYSISGSLCRIVDGNPNELSIDVSDLFSGAYFIVAERNGMPITKTFYILR